MTKEKTLQQKHIAAINQLHKAKKVIDGLKDRVDKAQTEYDNALKQLSDIEEQLGIKKNKQEDKQQTVFRTGDGKQNPLLNIKVPSAQDIYNQI